MKKKKKYYTVVAGLCVMIAGALFLCGRSEAALGRDGVVITLETDRQSREAEVSEAQKNVEKTLKNFTIQDSIESIIKAKGFSDCLCTISDEGVSVIVPEGELNDNSVLVIDDAVVTHYDVAYENISIIGA